MRVQATRSIRRTARMVFLCALAAMSLSCQRPETPPVSSEAEPSDQEMTARADEGAVISAHRALIRALQDGDVDSAMALLDTRASLLIFHPFKENRFDGYDETREGLSRMLGRMQDMEWTEVHQAFQINGDVAWLTSQVLVKSDELEAPFVGRGTEIWVRRFGEWKLSHGHWSEHARLAGGD